MIRPIPIWHFRRQPDAITPHRPSTPDGNPSDQNIGGIDEGLRPVPRQNLLYEKRNLLYSFGGGGSGGKPHYSDIRSCSGTSGYRIIDDPTLSDNRSSAGYSDGISSPSTSFALTPNHPSFVKMCDAERYLLCVEKNPGQATSICNSTADRKLESNPSGKTFPG